MKLFLKTTKEVTLRIHDSGYRRRGKSWREFCQSRIVARCFVRHEQLLAPAGVVAELPVVRQRLGTDAAGPHAPTKVEIMTQFDVKCMSEAVEWANGCSPIKESIPK